MLLCLAVGVGLQVWIAYAGHRREAWDSPLFWSAGMPVAVLVSAAIGYLTKGNGWLAPGLILPGFVMAMSYRGGDLGLWPLTIAASFVLSLPFVGVAWAASRFRRR
jgi:hypothetical protein